MSKSKSRSENSSFESRRQMLKIGACGAMTNTTFMSTLMHLKMTNALMADTLPLSPTGDYKALVCLFFNGAIDSFNVLMPHGTAQNDPDYTAYYNTRRSNTSLTVGSAGAMIAPNGATLKRNQAFDGTWSDTVGGTVPTPAAQDYGYMNPIVDSASGKTFGLHPQFPNLKTIYDAGDATFIANCGALLEPLANNNDYNNSAKKKPIGLFSHPDQQRHWQTAVPESRNEVRGWGGRMSDLLNQGNSSIFTNLSTAGQSLFLTGQNITPYTIGTSGAVKLNGYQSAAVTSTSPTTSYDRIFSRAQQSSDYATQVYTDILENTTRNTFKDAREAALVYQDAFVGTSVGTGFPTTGLGAQLAAVAKTIKLSQSGGFPAGPLAQRRQIFLVQIGGWDHHANLLNSQRTMIKGIDDGLKAFYDFLSLEGILSNVTTFSISDFARTWSYNGSGTDHAWGANTIVMGGAVNKTTAPRIYGSYPTITIDTSGTGRDRGRGVIIPSTSSDSYHDVICRWFGVPDDSNLATVLPHIREFRAAGAGSTLQFLS